jgi:hypothetical protein
MIDLLKRICNYVCFFRVKSLLGSILGILFIIANPIGLLGVVMIGTLIGCWVAGIVDFISHGKENIIRIAGFMGTICGYIIMLTLFTIIGANLGNLIGYGVSSIVKVIKQTK